MQVPLQLQGNQLMDLKATLAVLSKLTCLQKLGLANNPLANEPMYREATIFAIPSLTFLDTAPIEFLERHLATKHFTAKRIEKKLAFGNSPLVYDRPEKIPLGSPCVGELRLRETNAATLRRRKREAQAAAAVELQ